MLNILAPLLYAGLYGEFLKMSNDMADKTAALSIADKTNVDTELATFALS